MLYLELFNKNYVEKSPRRGKSKPRDLPYLKRVYHYNLTAIKKYYLERSFAVKNRFFLSRMLDQFDPKINDTPQKFIDYIRNRGPYIGKHFKMTSEMEEGIIHPGVFLGKDNEEVLIAENDYFNIDHARKNWRTLNCIEFLRHEINDLEMLLPNGRKTGSVDGIPVLLINLPMLFFKYRYFMIEQLKNSEKGESVLTKNHFIYRHVLPPMLDSQTDHMFLNRVMDTYYEREIEEPRFKHPFKIFRPDNQIERYAEDTLDSITRKPMEFVDALNHIQLITKESALDLLVLPEAAPTLQIRWALFLSRLRVIEFLYDLEMGWSREHGKTMNRHFINDFKRLAQRLLKDRRYRNMFSYDIEKNILSSLEKLADA